jgi:hypothetical protein
VCRKRRLIRLGVHNKGFVGETNKHRYVVATQSKGLRETLRQLPGVPLLLLDRSVMVLERPGEITIKAKLQVIFWVCWSPNDEILK